MTGKNGKLIASSTPNSVVGSFIISFNGPDTNMSVWVGSQRKTSGMLRSWWTNSISVTQGSRDSGGKGSNWRSFSFLLWLDAVQYEWPLHGLYHLRITLKTRWSFTMHHIHRTIVEFVSCLIVCFSFSLYVDMQPRRSAAREGKM